jgi:hypothetical protein
MRKYGCVSTVLLQIFYLSKFTMNQVHDVIVITSCTNRKKKAGAALALEGTDHASSLCGLAQMWMQQLQTADTGELRAAVDLYAGRSITEAKRTAESLSAPLYIVSAGHGLLRWNDCIPPYNVTVSPTPDNTLHRCLLRLEKSPADWWQALVQTFGKQRSLAELATRSPNAIVLLAVPSAYLTLLAGELAELRDDEIERLRILTSTHGASSLPARLRSAVMPYDERLEGLTGHAGTRSDFPQRALSHFVGVLKGHKLPLEIARKQVLQEMNSLQKPALPERQRKTDEEIIALLRQNWARCNGSATALLRYLRDDALVACEQSRFRSLRHHVQLELNEKAASYG